MHEKVATRFEARADRYRSVPGLIQNYYVHFQSSGEHGGLYVWDSPDSMRQWRETNRAETLADTDQVTRSPDVELADVLLVRHAERAPNQAS